MKKIIALLIIIVVVYSCTPKMTPSKPETPVTPPPDTIAVVIPGVPDLVAGKDTYIGKCAHCHELKEPGDYTAARWVDIVGWMAPKARLSAEEKQNVLAYVQAHAKAG